MDAIAADAHVAKGTLYYQFNSKEGIVDAIVERDAEAIRAHLDHIEADSESGFIDKLAALIGAMTELITASYLKIGKMKYIDILDKTLRSMVLYCAPPFARVLEQGKKEGMCAIEYPLEYAEIFLACTQALFPAKAGLLNSIRRMEALVSFSALLLGMDKASVEHSFMPFINYAKSLPADEADE